MHRPAHGEQHTRAVRSAQAKGLFKKVETKGFSIRETTELRDVRDGYSGYYSDDQFRTDCTLVRKTFVRHVLRLVQ